MHVDREVLGDRAGDEGNELLGQPAQHDARVRGCVDVRELRHAARQLDVVRAHGRGEERLLGRHVAQHRGGGDVQLAGDVGQRGGLEAFGGENAPRGVEELFPGDARGASHL